VIAIADHQAVAVLVELVDELLHIGGGLGFECGGQHLPCTVTDDLIEQRPTDCLVVGLLHIMNYREHGRTFPNQRANAGSLRQNHAGMAVSACRIKFVDLGFGGDRNGGLNWQEHYQAPWMISVPSWTCV
jgi:hypothetical protein